jgi:hypothetical protein
VSDWWEVGYPGGPPVGPGKLARALYFPGNSSGKPASSDGPDVVAMKRAVSRLGRWPWGMPFDDTYSRGFACGTGGNVRETGVAGVQRQQWIAPTGQLGDATYQALRYARIPEALPHAGEHAFDPVALDLLEQSHELPPAPVVPSLGPMFAGGKSVLQHDLTHATSGIPLYPAFDDAFAQGVTIIAPEALTITRASSSNPGDACYAEGASGLRYWIGHLTTAPSVGREIPRGGTLGVTCVNGVGGGPHVHVGCNVELLWGDGAELAHHTNYTHGAPTIGDQLAAVSVL